MLRFKHYFMRIFAVLLTTMFIVNTVYAGSMMVSVNLTQFPSGDSTHHVQHHDGTGTGTGVAAHAHAQHHQHETDIANDVEHKSASHHNCKQCNHCLACFSVLMPVVLEIATSTNQPVLAIGVTSLYSSPTSPLLQRPPIA